MAEKNEHFDAAAARALSNVDIAGGIDDAIAKIKQSAQKGWGSTRLDGSGWREASLNGEELREKLSGLGFGVTFDPANRCTFVTW